MNLQVIGERSGAPRTCGSCRYWSEMLAKCDGGGPVQAMCLGKGSLAHQHTTERQSCEAWASGHLGAVDTPDEEPPDYEDDDAIQAARSAAGCRTCSECVGDPHHWIEHCDDPGEPDPFVGYVCKHCEARADICDECSVAIYPMTGVDRCAECTANGDSVLEPGEPG